MLKIKEAIVVEGKYDKIKLSSLVEGVIIETKGFGGGRPHHPGGRFSDF